MTTNIFDGNSRIMATDSRWSVEYGDFLFYLDDTGYDKIEISHGKALMFAGFGGKIQQWKDWIRSNPTSPAGMPTFKGMSVCLVDIVTQTVEVDSEQDIIQNGVYCAGSGALAAYSCWLKNKCALTAVETAKSKDIYSGGEVKFVDLPKGTNNLTNQQRPTAQITIDMVNRAISQRGIVMKMNVQAPGSPVLPFPKSASAQSAAADKATEEEIRTKIANGELSANAPCDGMHNDWSEENKQKFAAALAKMFGWK